MEYLEVLQLKTSDEVAENIMMTLLSSKNIELHDVYFRWKLITGDEDDDKFYDLAIAANADYLVTNDQHFNVAKEITFPSISIISAKDFTQLLSTSIF